VSRALILDRDGVINVDKGYLHRIEDVVFIDGLFPLLRDFRDRGFRMAIATNQSGIGQGLFDEAQFEVLMRWMLARFADEGIAIDAVYHCPDHPTLGLGAHRRETPRRKPGPGMFLEAIRDLGLDASASWTIGDKDRDIEAAAAAGIGTRVKLDEAAVSVERRDDHWVVPRLAAIHDLLDQAPAIGS
jgi:D-glycero-D-manno-heptose 1,7-bisphosphate phosphatase